MGAIVLAGGGSRRMGADKAELDWDGRRAIDRVIELALMAGAEAFISVSARDHGVLRISEEPPGGGPVAAICAGVAYLRARGLRRFLILAVDAPTVSAEDLSPLIEAGPPGAAFVGLNLPLVLNDFVLPDDRGIGWPVARLIDVLRLRRLPVPANAAARLRGANTPRERDLLRGRIARGSYG